MDENPLNGDAKHGDGLENECETALETQSCSCLDFIENRRIFRLNDPRRLCRHLVARCLADPGQVPPGLAQHMKRIAWFKHDPAGFPLTRQITTVRLTGGGSCEIFIPLDMEGGRLSVFHGPKRYEFDLADRSWVNGQAPPEREKVEREIDGISRLMSQSGQAKGLLGPKDDPPAPDPPDPPLSPAPEISRAAEDAPRLEPGPLARPPESPAPARPRKGPRLVPLLAGLALILGLAGLIGFILSRPEGPKPEPPPLTAPRKQSAESRVADANQSRSAAGARAGEAERVLSGPSARPDDQAGLARAMLEFMDQVPGKNLYVISFEGMGKKWEFVANHPKDVLVLARIEPDGRGRARVWRGEIQARLELAAQGPGLDRAQGFAPGADEDF